MHVADILPDSKSEYRIQGDWTDICPLEGVSKPSELTAHVRHHVPQCAALVSGGPWDGDRHH